MLRTPAAARGALNPFARGLEMPHIRVRWRVGLRRVPAEPRPTEQTIMQETWSKPQVTEEEVGLEVTSYVSAEIEDA
jgi:coenzyme PQQ precursor peptide PqqA